MGHFRIMVYLDGVIYKWSDTARWLLEWKFGIEVGESTHWNHILEQTTEEQWKWLWSSEKDGGIGRGLFRHGNCYKGSFEALKVLDEIGDLVIITHRPKAALKDTMDWISYNDIPAPTVHVMYREEPKSSVKPGCDIYVDDKFENVVDLFENTQGLVCLWDRPWNHDGQKHLPKEIQVVESWDQFITLAKEQAAWKITTPV
jgi:uncharacterized HAD superfamily protein